MKTGAHYGLLTKIKWYAIIKRAVLVMKVCKTRYPQNGLLSKLFQAKILR